jgi:hypothetical protein
MSNLRVGQSAPRAQTQPPTEKEMVKVSTTTINCVYVGDCDEDDLHKAIEARGRIAIGEIRVLVNSVMSEEDQAAIKARLDVLAMMLACQAGEEVR